MRVRRFVWSVALSLGAICTTSSAQPVLIDFEQTPGMVNSPGAPIPEESRLADQYVASHGVRFASGAPYVAVVIHGPGTPSGTRIIGGSTPGGQLTYLQAFPLTATFVDPTGTSPRIVSEVSVRGDLFSIPGTKTLEAYGLNDALLASQTRDDSDPNPLFVSAPGIHYVRFYSSSATVGFDDLRFDAPTSPCTGDANGDNVVNFSDVSAVLTSFGADYAPGTGPGDANGDGLVNFGDITAVLTNFNAMCP